MPIRQDRLAAALVPQLPGLQLDHVDLSETTVTVGLTSTTPTAAWPQCGQLAARVRSRYTRTIADLPWSGLSVHLHLTVRRFAYDHASCSRRIFTEHLPALTLPYARRTTRLTALMQAVAFAIGGEGGIACSHAYACVPVPLPCSG